MNENVHKMANCLAHDFSGLSGLGEKMDIAFINYNRSYEETLYKLLRDIKANPAMYMQKPSLSLLTEIISTMHAAADVFLHYPMHFYNDFQNYIEKKYRGPGDPLSGWYVYLGKNRTEEEAFWLFYEEFDQFLKQQNFSENTLKPNTFEEQYVFPVFPKQVFERDYFCPKCNTKLEVMYSQQTDISENTIYRNAEGFYCRRCESDYLFQDILTQPIESPIPISLPKQSKPEEG